MWWAIKTFLVFVISLCLIAWVSKHIFGHDINGKQRPGEQIASGSCALPYIKSHSDFFELKAEGRTCVMHVVEGDWHLTKMHDKECIVHGYQFVGLLGEDNRWGKVCVVFLGEGTWNSVRERLGHSLPLTPILNRFTTMDVSESGRPGYRLLYEGAPGDEKALATLISEADAQLLAKAAFFGMEVPPRNSSITVFTARREMANSIGQSEAPLCEYIREGGVAKTSCPTARYNFWRRQTEEVSGLKPNERQSIFANAVKIVGAEWSSKFARGGRAAENGWDAAGRAAAMSNFDINSVRVEDSWVKPFLKSRGLKFTQLQNLVAEGHALGWAGDLIDEERSLDEARRKQHAELDELQRRSLPQLR